MGGRLERSSARLLETSAPALASLRQGVEDARTVDDIPAGSLRINTSYVAYATLFEPHVRSFLTAYPRLLLEFSINSAPVDIVGGGFDAGVRPGRALQQGMVAVPIGPVQRLVVVGAPSYLARAGVAKRPRDLLQHACIRQRVFAADRLLEWTLRNGKERATIDVKAALVLDDMRSVLDAARSGTGLAYLFEQFAARDLESGVLQRVLPSYALVREAFFLYFPSRRNLPAKLRVFVDWFRGKNETSR